MSRYACRSAFISDVHLGTADCKADYLLDFLRRLRCEKLYLVGDIIDLQALAGHPWWHPTHGAVLAELFEMAARGVEVTYIPGNHDAALRGLAGRSMGGIQIALDAVHQGADGRRYRVSHGDEYDPEGHGRAWLVALGERLHRLICQGNRGLGWLRQRLRLPYLPLSIILKSHSAKAMAYIDAYARRVADGAHQHGFDGHICGHIHYGQIRRIDGTLYMNDGDWVEHCTALVEDATGAMELIHWSEATTALARASREDLLTGPASALAFAPLQGRAVTDSLGSAGLGT